MLPISAALNACSVSLVTYYQFVSLSCELCIPFLRLLSMYNAEYTHLLLVYDA